MGTANRLFARARFSSGDRVGIEDVPAAAEALV
jgi:hypothetical protein